MSVLFGNIGAIKVSDLRAYCVRNSLPTSALDRCNRYTSPVGLHPGFGHIAVRGADLLKTDLTQSYPLVFDTDNPKRPNRVTLQGIRAVGEPYCVTPGLKVEEAAFVVEVTDHRFDLIGLSNACYNWREYPDAPFENWSLNDGQEWGYVDVVIDLLGRTGYPLLYESLFRPIDKTVVYPDQPSSLAFLNTIKPWQVDARGCRAADLVEDLLFQIGLYVFFDPTKTERPYSINSVGLEAEREDRLERYKVYDSSENLKQNFAKDSRKPGYVRTFFPVWQPSNGNTPSDQFAYNDNSLAGGNEAYLILSQSMFPARLTEVGEFVNPTEVATLSRLTGQAVTTRVNVGSVCRAYSGFHGAAATNQTWDAVCWQENGDPRYSTTTVFVRVGFQGTIPLRQVDPLVLEPSLRSTIAFDGVPQSNGFTVRGLASPAGYGSSSVIDRYGGVPAPTFARWMRNSGTYAATLRESVLDFASGMSSGLAFTRNKLTTYDSLSEGIGIEGNQVRKLFYPKPKSLQASVVRVTGRANDCGYYPGRVQHFDAANQAFVTGANCFVLEVNSSALLERRYTALRSDLGTCTEFVSGSGSGSGTGSGSGASETTTLPVYLVDTTASADLPTIPVLWDYCVTRCNDTSGPQLPSGSAGCISTRFCGYQLDGSAAVTVSIDGVLTSYWCEWDGSSWVYDDGTVRITVMPTSSVPPLYVTYRDAIGEIGITGFLPTCAGFDGAPPVINEGREIDVAGYFYPCGEAPTSGSAPVDSATSGDSAASGDAPAFMAPFEDGPFGAGVTATSGSGEVLPCNNAITDIQIRSRFMNLATGEWVGDPVCLPEQTCTEGFCETPGSGTAEPPPSGSPSEIACERCGEDPTPLQFYFDITGPFMTQFICGSNCNDPLNTSPFGGGVGRYTMTQMEGGTGCVWISPGYLYCYRNGGASITYDLIGSGATLEIGPMYQPSGSNGRWRTENFDCNGPTVFSFDADYNGFTLDGPGLYCVGYPEHITVYPV